MPNLSRPSPNLVAGLVLAALPLIGDLELPAPSASAVLEATGASRTTAYKVRSALHEALPTLIGPPGRPRAEPPPLADLTELHAKVLQLVFDHPGCVGGTALRRTYTDVYRVFVLDLFAEHHEVPLPQLAEAVGVPLPTLKDWIRGDRPQVQAPDTLARPTTGPSVAHVETVLEAFRSWTGKFGPFCDHVQFHCRVPIGRQHISDILQAHGLRIPQRRSRPADTSALRGGFETFHPGAQWIGDGTELVVTINGQKYVCNLELNVDVASGALVGASIRPTEDSAAVVEAYTDGVATTGAPPLALLLDNKPSNHTDDVVDALADTTTKLRARPYTPTDKPHAEGGFGLFAQQAPELIIDAADLQSLAAQIAALTVITWGRTINHRPRADRAGRSRVELYRSARPTPEEIEHANARFAERLAAEERARLTRQRRADPQTKAVLDEAFARLGLEDADARIRTALASWPLDAVLAGIAVFEGKQRRGTLPDGVDARYLRGIVVNMATEAESMAIADALLAERLRARDRALAGLQAEFDRLEQRDDADAEWLVRAYVGRSMRAERQIDRLYWLRATADVVVDQLDADQRPLLRLAARHISATHSLPKPDRDAAIRFLFAKAVPVS